MQPIASVITAGVPHSFHEHDATTARSTGQGQLVKVPCPFDLEGAMYMTRSGYGEG